MKSHIDYIFNPRSIALIGASRRKGSVGHGIAKNLLSGGVFESKYNSHFKGKVYFVNPNAKKILGRKAYNSIKDIKDKVDLAIIAVKANLVPKIMEECAEKKIKAAIIISAGFTEIGEKGKKLQDEFLKTAKKANIRLVGPNCLGIIKTKNHLNASFAPAMPPRGNIAFVSQSGALADSIIDWSIENRYGFSTIISYGNKADLTSTDFIEWLGNDPETKAIALYIEGIKDGKRFIEVAKKVSKKKPIIALKAGISKEGTKAISSHTGSLAGSYEIYKAAFKQANIFMVDTVEDLFDVSKALAELPPCRTNSIAIVTNGGGCGVLAADYCSRYNVKLAKLKESTLKKLDNTKKMHPAYSRRNPLDIIGDALPERYDAAVNTLLKEDYISGIIIIQTLQTMTDPVKDAMVAINAHKKFKTKPIICTYMGGKFSKKGNDLLKKHNIPDYNDQRKAALAMAALIHRGKIIKSK